jgi:large subunit ribosomal protein L17
MFHNKAYRKLGRTHTHRMATLRALSTALFQRERIRTTLMKAKELRPFAEKLITRSKRDTLHARRLVERHIHDSAVARKLFTELSSRYTDRNGGYMRIFKLGRRQGDGAEMALVELIGSEPVFEKEKEKDKAAKKGLTSRLMGGRAKEEPAAEPEEAEEAAPEKAETAASPAGKTKRAKKPSAGAGKPAKAASAKKPMAKTSAKKKAAPSKGGKKK